VFPASLTGGAAAGALGWVRRLGAHPAMRDALAAGKVSESWARQMCEWSDLLPAGVRGDADAVLLGVSWNTRLREGETDATTALLGVDWDPGFGVAGPGADGLGSGDAGGRGRAKRGADLRDLGELAEEIRRRCAAPDADDDGGFGERGLRLGTTFRGAGKLDGDLTTGCAAALEALGKKAGPEDTRMKRQRDHDALHEACWQLVVSGGGRSALSQASVRALV
jgi:hypothetical protein